MRAAVTKEFPKVSGAYALLISLEEPLALPLSRFGLPTLDAARYVYAGSAFGPGGIAGRIRRHLKKTKKPHWHVDYLTNASTVIEVLAMPGLGECRIIQRLIRQKGVSVPLAGFGSSDCSRCPSHLLKFDPHRLSDVRHCLHDMTQY